MTGNRQSPKKEKKLYDRQTLEAVKRWDKKKEKTTKKTGILKQKENDQEGTPAERKRGKKNQ